MMQTISEWTPELVQQNLITTNYDPTLEMQLLVKRQTEYDQTLQRINNLKSTSMNILMLNKKGQDKLDGYNKELHEMLSQDLGDLSDPMVQSKVAGYFTKVSGDTDLKERSIHSKFYKDQIDLIEKMRSAPDPVKSGFNSINEEVWKNWEGGLNDFYNADDIEGWDQKKISYTPFKDITQKVANGVKLLGEEENWSDELPYQEITTADGKTIKVPTGYKYTHGEKGRSANKVRQWLQTNLNADELAQFKVLSQYRVLQQFNNPEGKLQLHTAYDNFVKNEQSNTKAELAQIQALKNQYDPTKLDKTLPDYDQRVALYTQLQQQYGATEASLQSKIKEQTANMITPENWMKMGMNEMLPAVNQMTIENYINGAAEALSTKSTYHKITTDQTYFDLQKMDIMRQRLALDQTLGMAKLALDQQKLEQDAKKSKSGSESGEDNWTEESFDIVKSTEDYIKTIEDFHVTTKDYAAKTDEIITAKDENGKYIVNTQNLQDKGWLDKNKDNYQVRLFQEFQAMNHGTTKGPADFEAFMTAVENGDYINNPEISNLYNGYISDKEVSQFLDEKAFNLAKITNNILDIENEALPGGDNTIADYAKAANPNWKKGDPINFKVADGKGGWETISMTEALDRIEKSDIPYNWKDRGVAGAVSTLAPTLGNLMHLKNDAESFVDRGFFYERLGNLKNDIPLVDLLLRVREKKNGANAQLGQAYADAMPGIVQNKRMVSTSDDAIQEVIGHIQAQLKGSSDKVPPAIPADLISQVTIPVGNGQYGDFVIKGEKAKLESIQNIPGIRLKVAGTDEYHEGKQIQANVRYDYKISPKTRYNVMTNWMFQEKGAISRHIAGYPVKVTKGAGSQIYVIIGNEPPRPVEYSGKDITTIMAIIERDLKMKAQAEKAAKPKS